MPIAHRRLDDGIGRNARAIDAADALGAQDRFQRRCVEGAHAMLDDVEVLGPLAELGMGLGPPCRRAGRCPFCARPKRSASLAGIRDSRARSPRARSRPALQLRAPCRSPPGCSPRCSWPATARHRGPYRWGRPRGPGRSSCRARDRWICSSAILSSSHDHFAGLEVGALRRTQPQQFAEHIILILAKLGCEPPNADIARS